MRAITSDTTRLCLPLEKWPDDDQQAWRKAISEGDILDEEEIGPRATCKPISNRKVESGYGRWLAVIGPQEWTKPPAVRVTPASVTAYLQDLSRRNAPSTVLNRRQELHDAISAIAPDRDWRWIRRVRTRDRRAKVPSARPELPELVELLVLGLGLMEAADLEPTPRMRALRFRDGLVIALLALCPLRRADLAALRRGEHLDDETGAWRLAGRTSKTDRLINVLFPPLIVPQLETYLRTHRPVLAQLCARWTRPHDNAVWLSSHGSPLCDDRLYVAVTKATLKFLDQRVGLHDFRRSAATSIAVHDPEHAYIIQAVLWHAGHASGARYNLAKISQAATRFQAVITALQDGTLIFPGDGEEAVLPQAPTEQPAKFPGTANGASLRSPALRRISDFTGSTIGRLAVLHRTGRTAKGYPRWQVRCTNCGTETEMRRSALLAIHPPTTGCELCDYLDELKQVFIEGRCVRGGHVVDHGGRDQHGYHAWLCRCDCGASFKRTTGQLRRATQLGLLACPPCTALQSEKHTTQALLLDHLKRDRQADWKLNDEYALGLVTRDCASCGAPPQRLVLRHPDGAGYSHTRANAIDRLDPRLGYFIRNVRTSCLRCMTIRDGAAAQAPLAVRTA